MRTSRVYTEEFKQQAVKLAAELNSNKKAAIQLGIPIANIYEWQRKVTLANLTSTTPSSPVNSTEREELLRLRKEVSDLKKVNHILKSAAAFFSQDHLK